MNASQKEIKSLKTIQKKFISFEPANKMLEIQSIPLNTRTVVPQPIKTIIPKRAKTSKIMPKSPISKASTITKKGMKLNKFYTSSFKTESKQNRGNNELKLNLAQAKSVGEHRPSHTPINLLNHIRILIKAANILRFRTKFRDLRFINEKQIGLINDESNFQGKLQKNYFLKRFTEKNMLKKLYYNVMSWVFSNMLLTNLLDKYVKICKFFEANTPVIKPFQKGKVLWDVLILFTITFFFFVIPLQLSFGFNYEDEFHDIFLSYGLHEKIISFLILIPELLLILDSLLKLITGYYENGLVIINRREIIHHYLKKGLIFDLLSYFSIILQSVLQDATIFLKILQLLVFCKLKRVQLIMNNFREMISLNGKNDYILGLIILTFQIIFFCHINACLWHSVAFYYPVSNTTTWLDYANIKHFEWSTRYYYSLFWAVSVMVTIGFGEKVSPQNNAELMMGVLIFLGSALFYGFTINCMREIFDEMAKHEREYKECLSVINQYMNSKNINFELQGRVRKYLEYIMHKETNVEKESAILNKLTFALKKEVILESNGKFIYEIPLFNQNFSAKTLEQLAFSLKQVRYSPEEYIYHINDIDNCSLFIVAKGELEMVYEKEHSVKSVHTFKRGEILGIKSFFTDNPRENSIRSWNFSTLFEIKQSDFLKIIKKYPEDYERFLWVKDQIKFNHYYNSTQLKCISCDKTTHLYSECPLIHFIPDRDFIIKRSLCSKPQERSDFNRKKRKKYNSRFNINCYQSAILYLGSSVFSDNDDVESEQNEEINLKPQTQLLIGIPSEEENSKEKIFESSEIDLSPQNFKKNESSSSSPRKDQQKIISKFPSIDDQQLVETKEIKNKNLKGFNLFQNTPKFSTEENFDKEKKMFGKVSEGKIPSQNAIRRVFTKKKTIVQIEKEEGKENYIEKYKEYESNWMFFYDFEKMRNYNYYFTQNNVKNVLEKMLEKKLSPVSFSSKRNSNKKRVEKRIRSSKFMINDHINMPSRQSKGSDISKNEALCNALMNPKDSLK